MDMTIGDDFVLEDAPLLRNTISACMGDACRTNQYVQGNSGASP